FPGVPAIYIQSILGSRNDYDGVEKLGYKRAINRKKYQRTEIEAELKNETTLRHRVYHALSRLVSIRRNNKAFHPESEFFIKNISPCVMQIERVAKTGESVVALFNVSDSISTVNSEKFYGTDLISETNITGEILTLHPWQVLWIKK
ncbi:TPA: sugar phosphorylase, partial [Salmonella enterica]|nr:sugar phosphorylase [Salmonella enterica subsp. enterica]HAE2753037.1 sugar phosphorylase [Salmonella enterica subsp. indica]HCL5362919.1 sugar phosphorylase [Salmonella enterica]